MLNNIIKPGLILLLITVIAAALLGYVNSVTKEPIAQQEKMTNENAMKEVVPSAKSFENAIDLKNDSSIINNYSKGVDSDGNAVGYAFSVTTKGFSAGLNLMIGIANDGTISGVKVISHEETPGLGANSQNPDFTNQYTGKSGELSVSKSGTPSDTEIQAITGATITSKAVTNAVNEVQNYFKQLGEGGTN